jgi:hypothetical protein
MNKGKPNKIYKDETTIFGRVVCTHCGINTNLLYVELSWLTENFGVKSSETVLCRDCWEDLPTLEDETENEAV